MKKKIAFFSVLVFLALGCEQPEESPTGINELPLTSPSGVSVAKNTDELIDYIRIAKQQLKAEIEVNKIEYYETEDTSNAIISFTILPHHQDQVIFTKPINCP